MKESAPSSDQLQTDAAVIPSFIRPRLCPKRLAAEVHFGLNFDFDVAIDGALTREPHFVFVADGRQHAKQSRLLHDSLGRQVLHALLDEDPAFAAGAMAKTIHVTSEALIDLYPL